MVTIINFLNLFLGATSIVLVIFLIIQNPAKKVEKLEFSLSQLEKNQEKLESLFRDEIRKNREEQANTLKSNTDSLIKSISEISVLQKNQLENFSNQINALTSSNEGRMDKLRESVDQNMDKLRQSTEDRLKSIQEDNSTKLEQMRATVDEKLSATLETRLGESFKLVSERLEQVHKGLGEMQTLASGVGDLKKVLTNVKTRGTWGEVQLGNLLEQIFTPEQYEKNAQIKKGSAERVEFAIKLPGQNGSKDKSDVLWLPIDSKFPQEDYQRLVDATEKGNQEAAEDAIRQLEMRLKSEAKTISDKYISPPNTTDFAIMFLPTEGLYSEALRRAGLCDQLQRDHRILVTGPTTLAALLNCLQMGFKTLAIEKHSSDVWKLLGAVKQEFGKFGDILDKTHKKLQEASNTIEEASKKTRNIEKRLKNVDTVSIAESETLLALADDTN